MGVFFDGVQGGVFAAGGDCIESLAGGEADDADVPSYGVVEFAG